MNIYVRKAKRLLSVCYAALSLSRVNLSRVKDQKKTAQMFRV